MIWEGGIPAKDELLISNVRHKEALCRSIECCNRVTRGLKENISPEFLTFDMRGALKELGSIIGTDISEDILSSIFLKFCIGK